MPNPHDKKKDKHGKHRQPAAGTKASKSPVLHLRGMILKPPPRSHLGGSYMSSSANSPRTLEHVVLHAIGVQTRLLCKVKIGENFRTWGLFDTGSDTVIVNSSSRANLPIEGTSSLGSLPIAHPAVPESYNSDLYNCPMKLEGIEVNDPQQVVCVTEHPYVESNQFGAIIGFGHLQSSSRTHGYTPIFDTILAQRHHNFRHRTMTMDISQWRQDADNSHQFDGRIEIGLVDPNDPRVSWLEKADAIRSTAQEGHSLKASMSYGRSGANQLNPIFIGASGFVDSGTLGITVSRPMFERVIALLLSENINPTTADSGGNRFLVVSKDDAGRLHRRQLVIACRTSTGEWIHIPIALTYPSRVLASSDNTRVMTVYQDMTGLLSRLNFDFIFGIPFYQGVNRRNKKVVYCNPSGTGPEEERVGIMPK